MQIIGYVVAFLLVLSTLYMVRKMVKYDNGVMRENALMFHQVTTQLCNELEIEGPPPASEVLHRSSEEATKATNRWYGRVREALKAQKRNAPALASLSPTKLDESA